MKSANVGGVAWNDRYGRSAAASRGEFPIRAPTDTLPHGPRTSRNPREPRPRPDPQGNGGRGEGLLGYLPETTLTLGRFVAGSSARAKAWRLGISDEKRDAEERRARAAEFKPRRQTVRLLGRDIPVSRRPHAAR